MKSINFITNICRIEMYIRLGKAIYGKDFHLQCLKSNNRNYHSDERRQKKNWQRKIVLIRMNVNCCNSIHSVDLQKTKNFALSFSVSQTQCHFKSLSMRPKPSRFKLNASTLEHEHHKNRLKEPKSSSLDRD